MKKYLFIMSLTIALIGCSKSDGDTQKEKTPKVTSDTFSATIKDGFTGENGEELILHRNLKNILVGDLIPYTLTIKEKETSSNEKYVYMLVPIKTSDKNHQFFQVDYEIYTDNEKIRKEENPYIKINGSGKYKFYIKPLVPGSFKIPFKLVKRKVVQKEEKKEMQEIGEITFPTVNFNAVKITLLRDNQRVGYKLIKTIFYDNYYTYRFKMEDGENETDIYLSPPPSDLLYQTFTIKYKEYDNQISSDNLTAGKEYSIGDKVNKLFSIADITIVQKMKEKEELRIEYYDIPILKGKEETSCPFCK
ncbi:hypothetical protein OL230_00320 [Capnocytophaga ochracea]|uniref:hypothetical protein n=1 Tax=Capnocytophaga ochracea TaxID=1018 RepID=UPI00222F8BAE|nr:hypothetical protein [Capnocytophaga ochracea]UZD38641.1 hypothetical protein OL230_00320 [Capnocytophaga ochracea]